MDDMILTQSETLSNVAKNSKIAKKLDSYQKSKCTFLNSFQEALQLNKKKRFRFFFSKKGASNTLKSFYITFLIAGVPESLKEHNPISSFMLRYELHTLLYTYIWI